MKDHLYAVPGQSLRELPRPVMRLVDSSLRCRQVARGKAATAAMQSQVSGSSQPTWLFEKVDSRLCLPRLRRVTGDYVIGDHAYEDDSEYDCQRRPHHLPQRRSDYLRDIVSSDPNADNQRDPPSGLRCEDRGKQECSSKDREP